MTRWVFERASQLCGSLSDVFLYAAAAVTPLNEVREGVRQYWADWDGEGKFGTTPFPWEQDLLARFVSDGQGERVLIVGCGSCRDAIPLLQRGCTVTGVDPAEEALERGRRRLAELGYAPRLDCAFFEDWEHDAVFDVCWFSWFVYSHMPDSRRRIQALRKAARCLAPGGRVVLCYMNQRVVSRAAALGRRIGNMWGRPEWRLEDGDVLTRLPGKRVPRYDHRFTLDEIQAEANAAGLHLAYVLTPIVVLKPDDGAGGSGFSASITRR